MVLVCLLLCVVDCFACVLYSVWCGVFVIDVIVVFVVVVCVWFECVVVLRMRCVLCVCACVCLLCVCALFCGVYFVLLFRIMCCWFCLV